MRIIIFEGIASSGKTTIEKQLARRLGDVTMISEDQTLMPLIDNRDSQVAIEHLKNMVGLIQSCTSEFVIVDRFHLTHAFRTKVGLDSFFEIEDELKALGNVMLVLLTIDDAQIPDRIAETMRYREGGWNQGGQGAQTFEEKIRYYTYQQETLKRLMAESRLETKVINTTMKDWGDYADQLVKIC